MAMNRVKLYFGDCVEILQTLETDSVEAVITDPPYPCIDREYGKWTVEEWFEMMKVVVRESKRIIKPTGSAMFVLQPNYGRVGVTRP